jgi:hypothetical protein
MGREMRFAPLGLLLLAAAACKSGEPVSVALAASSQDAAGADASAVLAARCLGPPLPLGDVTFEWTEEDVPKRLELKLQRILHGGVEVGRVSGSCLLDAQGHVLRSVAASGAVTGSNGEPVGTLVRRDSIRADGETVHVGYVFTEGPEGGTAIGDAGLIFHVPPKGDGFSLPAGAHGDVVRARRTVLVLAEARTFFEDMKR